MKAYAILDGGGVKGAALAGALSAAAEQGIKLLGYGGTSAGAIVALLAAVRFTPNEIRHICINEINFCDFLDDGGVELEELKRLGTELNAAWRDSGKLFGKVKGTFSTANVLYGRRRLINKLMEELGLYTGSKLRTFLQLKLELKIGKPPPETGFSFRYLNECGCVPLKIVAADLGRRAPTVYSLKNTPEGSVLDAVRASMSYPFVFQPVLLYNAYQVDGGLSSNLPLSVFEEERRRDGATVVAFDLEASRKDQPAPYGMKEFCGDLLPGIHHVRISIPEGIEFANK